MSYQKFFKEINKALHQISKDIDTTIREKRQQIYNTQLEVLGLNMTEQRKINKKGYSFYQKSEEEILEIWDYIWQKSQIFEVKNQALLYYQTSIKNINPEKYWPSLKNWAQQLDNWEHSDRLSHIYSQFLEKNNKEIYPTLQEWNSSSNAWLRRQSIVSLLYYSSLRKEYPKQKKYFL